MPYKVELNRVYKTARLVYYSTERGTVAPRRNKGEVDRRILVRLEDGSSYHATKGWRRPQGRLGAIKQARKAARVTELDRTKGKRLRS